MLIVFTTVSDREAAELLARKIVESKLAACVQVMPEMRSIYVWEGEVQSEAEHLLLIKSLPERWDELRELISADHPYEVPEIVAVESSNVAEPYRAWLSSVLAGG